MLFAVPNLLRTSTANGDSAVKDVPCGMKTKKIKSIKPAGKADVYNITTKNHHNFIVAGGFVLHNCDALRYFVSTVIKARRIANA